MLQDVESIVYMAITLSINIQFQQCIQKYSLENYKSLIVKVKFI